MRLFWNRCTSSILKNVSVRLSEAKKDGQCADYSVKSQISRSYWVENSIFKEPNYTQYTKI